MLPKAVIIGSTTDGEIMDGKVSSDKTVLNFTQFEHTRLKTESVTHQKDGFFSGQSLAKALIQDDTKLIIAFADGLHTNGEAFLEGIHSVNPDVIVAGGLAADHATFDKTYVFTKESVMTHGAVAVALSGTELNVYNDYSFNWRCIGKELTITKVEHNRVYTIDDRTAVDTYIHYLGEEMAEDLPAICIEFPLISDHDGIILVCFERLFPSPFAAHEHPAEFHRWRAEWRLAQGQSVRADLIEGRRLIERALQRNPGLANAMVTDAALKTIQAESESDPRIRSALSADAASSLRKALEANPLLAHETAELNERIIAAAAN